MKKIIIILLLCLIVVIAVIAYVLFENGGKKVDFDQMTEVRILRFGTMIPKGDEYKLTLNNENWEASYIEDYSDDNMKKTYVDEEFVNKIREILMNYKVQNWDGFNKKKKLVTDGTRYECYVSFSDGTTIEAKGYMKYPKNFNEVLNEFGKMYAPLFEE